MKIKIYIKTLLVSMLLSSGVFAQNENENAARREKIEAFKVSFITQKMKLSPEEARVFWPVYNMFQDDLDAIRRNRKKEIQSIKGSVETMNDKEIEMLVDGEMAFRQQELDVKKKYHTQFKKIVPLRKIALLYNAEEDFKRELLKKIQEKSSNK